MLTKEQIITSLNAVADQIEAMCSEHESDSHGGEMCPVNRWSVVGFLAHRLGCKPGPTAGLAFNLMLTEYDENCPGCNADRTKEN